MSDSGYPRFWNWLNSGSVKVRRSRYFFCTRISLRYQENYVWPSLKCHVSTPWPVGRVSLPRALQGLWGGDEWQFRLRMDIAVHPGITKGGIQRKHIFLLWAGREGHNEQTLVYHRRLKNSFGKNYVLQNKSMHSIYYFADINECETGKHHCDSNAFCNNTKGSYSCTCKPEFTGNGVNCTGKIRKRKPSTNSSE